MRVMVALQNRFLRTRSGNIYSTTVCDYSFWCRYLQVFDEVVVLARVGDIDRQELDKPPASGPNVRFMAIPYYIGPWQYMRRHFQMAAIVKKAIEEADVFILRVPGVIGGMLGHDLIKAKIPYAVEVVGDPWEAGAPGGIKCFLRPVIRRRARVRLRRLCRMARLAAYVTAHCLQNRYPPTGFSTYFSDVAIDGEVIIDKLVLEKRTERARSKFETREPWRLCFVGGMDHLIKAPDILVDSVALCAKRGLNFQLIMVGDGKYLPDMENRAKILGISDRVRFIGRVSPGKPVFEQLDDADLFLLPSRTEGLPRAMVEAMARALPCIGGAVGGIPELLAAEDLVPPGDAVALASKIISVLSDPDRLAQMSARNLQTAREYEAEKLNRRRIEFYRKVAELGKETGDFSSAQ